MRVIAHMLLVLVALLASQVSGYVIPAGSPAYAMVKRQDLPLSIPPPSVPSVPPVPTLPPLSLSLSLPPVPTPPPLSLSLPPVSIPPVSIPPVSIPPVSIPPASIISAPSGSSTSASGTSGTSSSTPGTSSSTPGTSSETSGTSGTSETSSSSSETSHSSSSGTTSSINNHTVVNVPQPCLSTCEPYNEHLLSCTNASCVCSSVSVQDMETCLNCALNADAAFESTAQQFASNFTSGCAMQGIQVNPISLKKNSSIGHASISGVLLAGAALILAISL